jgi:Immunity protein 53
MLSTLEQLEKWYSARCNGDWEHQWGVEIGTLDNPGWRVRIDLAGTPKHGATLEQIAIERSEQDWIICWTADNRFHIACGPENLSEAIPLFMQWFGSN